jgi:putative Holliday junction resolvase
VTGERSAPLHPFANNPRTTPLSTSVLGFDFGEKYIGVAVGDSETGIASPLTLIAAEANDERFARIAALIAEWHPGRLVVGLPLSVDGAEHDLTRRARRFGRQLDGRFRLPVSFADERHSSAAAEDALRGMGRGGRAHKHDSHALAAQIILQAWLDEQRAGRAPNGMNGTDHGG